MALHRRGVAIPTRVELSRTRTLANSIVLEGSRGTLEWKFGERYKLRIAGKESLVDPVSGAVRPAAIEAAWSDEPDQPGYEGFRAQIDDFVRAIETRTDGQLSGESVLPSVDLIEQCYAHRTPLDERWFSERLPEAVAGRPRIKAPAKRVLITGASGFIGCRLGGGLHFWLGLECTSADPQSRPRGTAGEYAD
jgi:hypothetical protein